MNLQRVEVKKMPRRTPIDPAAAFQPINGAARATGLAASFIRKGVRDGTIPAIRIGAGSYMIDMAAFLSQLHQMAAEGSES